MSLPKISGHHPTARREAEFENGYIGVRGWLFNVSNVLMVWFFIALSTPGRSVQTDLAAAADAVTPRRALILEASHCQRSYIQVYSMTLRSVACLRCDHK